MSNEFESMARQLAIIQKQQQAQLAAILDGVEQTNLLLLNMLTPSQRDNYQRQKQVAAANKRLPPSERVPL